MQYVPELNAKGRVLENDEQLVSSVPQSNVDESKRCSMIHSDGDVTTRFPGGIYDLHTKG